MTFYDDIYPFYPLPRTSFIFSTNLLTVILVFVVLAASFLLILPGIRGKLRILWMFRIIISFFTGAVIVALNFTADWAQAGVSTNSTYKAFSSVVITADVGLHVGLNSVNITLKGTPVNQLNETINYNEEFSWLGDVDEQYTEALHRGLPNPILYMAEKFTRNSACGLIYQYRYSGRYASATLWTAFCCWLLANMLLCMPVLQYAGYMMLATAAFIFLSMASFSTIFNLPQCAFTIGDATFSTSYSHSFWLALATGVLCTLIGVLVVLLDWLVPERVREAFSVGADDDVDHDDVTKHSFPLGYFNADFLEGVAIEGALTKEVTVDPLTISHLVERL